MTEQATQNLASRKAVEIEVPDFDWVHVAAGEFPYGMDEEREEVYVDDFSLSRYLVTNRQFQCFIDDDGYKDLSWWAGLLVWTQEEKPPQPEVSTWPHSNRPKTNVNWYEATAFCRWTSSRLGYPVSLPNEHQWEKAATGGREGDVFAWGEPLQKEESGETTQVHIKARANVAGSLNQTSTVGMYLLGNTLEPSQGIADLSGNVWEWCANLYGQSGSVVSHGPNDLAALRGGCWGNDPERCRARVRSLHPPGARDGSIGFRLCCSLPSTGH